ncbi:hypothetical protein CMK11_09440 [Candidatus Poribacteria bacterium]|nr:hypothetical protein [Candidatus Poribacteria bacterium]
MYSWVDGQTPPIWALFPMGHRAGWGESMRSRIAARRHVTSITHRRCVQASRKEKAGILDEFVETTRYNPSYAARALRNGVSEARSRSSPPRAPCARTLGSSGLSALTSRSLCEECTCLNPGQLRRDIQTAAEATRRPLRVENRDQNPGYEGIWL